MRGRTLNWPRILGAVFAFGFGIWAWVQIFRMAGPILRRLGGHL